MSSATCEGTMLLPLKNSFLQTQRNKVDVAFALGSFFFFFFFFSFGFLSSLFEIVKLVRSGIFLPEGTSLPEKPRVASTRKEDYMPVGVRGPIKIFLKGGKITFRSTGSCL